METNEDTESMYVLACVTLSLFMRVYEVRSWSQEKNKKEDEDHVLFDRPPPGRHHGNKMNFQNLKFFVDFFEYFL